MEQLIAQYGFPIAIAVGLYAILKDELRRAYKERRQLVENVQTLVTNHIAHLTRAIEALTEEVRRLNARRNI